MEEKEFYKSKKLWAAVIGSVIAYLGTLQGIDSVQIITILSPIMTYIFGQAFVDGLTRRKTGFEGIMPITGELMEVDSKE